MHCYGTTSKGVQCARNALGKSKYCYQHHKTADNHDQFGSAWKLPLSNPYKTLQSK